MCGMTCSDDIACAIQLGVAAIGLIFYEHSKRSISIDHARTLLNNIPPFVSTVAVLVNPAQELVKNIVNTLTIDLLQFHGDEPPAFCEQFSKPYIKAIPASSKSIIESALKSYAHAKAILCDTPHTQLRGGTGQIFDWELFPLKAQLPIIVAGGLNVTNINAALERCKPYAIDVCSGVEHSFGVKDHKKMREFMKHVNAYNSMNLMLR